MQPWIKKTLVALLGAFVLAGGLTACAGRYDHRHGPMDAERMAEVRGKVMERIGRQLDLDEAQKQKLAALAGALQAQRAAMAGPAGDPRADMRALVAGPRFDRARAQALLDDKLRAMRAGGPGVIAAMADFYDSLHPEQQQKLRDFMERRRGWMGRHG